MGKGADQQEFVVHESFLTDRSEFFRAALSGDRWTETETREIKFPEDKPHIFALYLKYVYTGKLGTIHAELDDAFSMDTSTFENILGAEYEDLFRFYILAEKFLDVAAKNTSIRAVIATRGIKHSNGTCGPGYYQLAVVYEGTPVNSPCRRILIDTLSQYSASYVETALKNHINSIPKEALADLFIALAKSSSRPAKKGVEAYLEASGDDTESQPSTK